MQPTNNEFKSSHLANANWGDCSADIGRNRTRLRRRVFPAAWVSPAGRLQVHGHPPHLLVFQRRLRRINPRNLLALFKHLEDARLEFARHLDQHFSLRTAAGLDPGQIRHASGHRSVVVSVNVNKASKHRNVGLGVARDPQRILLIRIRLCIHLRFKVSRCILGARSDEDCIIIKKANR